MRLSARPRARFRWLALALTLTGAACGARSSLDLVTLAGDQHPNQPDDAGLGECNVDADCGSDPCAPMECREGSCAALPHVVCDDRDECTEDSCDSTTGLCVYRPLALDLDGDGYKSPRPGYAPGAPGSCGDDCDDTSAAAHPGGTEICDGVDNDCNGVIDDGAVYSTDRSSQRVSSTALERASGNGLAFDGTLYGASYTGHAAGKSHPYFQGLSALGQSVVPELTTSSVSGDTYAGGLLYNGQYFGSSWQDARQDGEYEIYFNRFDSKGKKLGPDLRVTDAPRKSLNPALAWNGAEFLDVWDDRRFDDGTGTDIRLFGQRVSVDGALVGANVQLTQAGGKAEYPALAVGQNKVGVVYTSSTADNNAQARFFTTDADFSNPSTPITIGSSGVNMPQLARVKGGFIAVWERTGSSGPGAAIYGAAVDEQGNVIASERAVTSGGPHARTPALLSLGDRVVLVWSEDASGRLALYREVLGADLSPQGSREQLTFSSAASYDPHLSFGPNGDLGVLFADESSGTRQAYFSHMSCSIVLPPCCKH